MPFPTSRSLRVETKSCSTRAPLGGGGPDSSWRWRYVVLDADPIEAYVAYGPALQAVIVGEQFPEWQLAGAAGTCSMADAQLRQIQWGALPPGVFDPTVPHPFGTHDGRASKPGGDWAAMGSSLRVSASAVAVSAGGGDRESAL